MNAPGLRAALAAGCDLVDGVWIARGRAEVAYADGGEAHVARVVAEAADIATGSPELARAIHDWPSQYHLAAARPNLLRPLALTRDMAVLEVGAGCGPITRYLGETCGTVLALEGNLTRARIAASRCRDLDNVIVVCADFPAFAAPGEFDLVTLVGVLEYSRMYVEAEDPVQAMLSAARTSVARGGRLVVAIENQLGVKYLAGAREDHLGVPFAGVTGEYGPNTPVTFGRGELRDRIARAGFSSVEFLYPFPDYKLPSSVLSGEAFSHAAFNASDLIATSYAYRFGTPDLAVYPESLARDVFIRNGLGAETANSFLAIAGERPSAPREAIAWAYSVGRDRPYSCETRFLPDAAGVAVERRPLYAGAAASIPQVREERSRYVEGEVLSRGLERLLSHVGWTVEALAAWAAPWIDFLARHAAAGAPRSPGLVLPAALFDCTPFNAIRRPDGTIVCFDLEWRPPNGDDHVTLAHVAFRGIYHALLRAECVKPPAEGVTTDIASIASAAMANLGLGSSSEQIHEWIALDYQMTGTIAGIPRATAMPSLPRLPVPEPPPPPPPPPPDRSAEFAARLHEADALLAQAVHRQRELAGRARHLDSILARPHHRVAAWFGEMIEPFPRLRAALRAPFRSRNGASRTRIGAIVHLYYDELWPELAAALAHGAPWDQLYVSIRADAPTSLEAAIASAFPLAKVRRVANRGRDAWPFLESLAMARRDGVAVVCKIHGKRSPHLPTGEAWRRDMIAKLLGSPEDVRKIVGAFESDPALGLLGPGGFLVPSSYYWERNAARVGELAARMGVDVDGPAFRYVAGSMFWARVEAVAPLLALGLAERDFPAEPAAADGELAHALERLFPLAARKAGFAVRETLNAAGTSLGDFAP